MRGFWTDYRLLYAASTISKTGGSFFPAGLAFAVLDLTGSAADLGYTLGASALVGLGFLLVGGAVADRWPRSGIIIGTTLGSLVIEVLAATVILVGAARLWELVALSAASGLFSAFSRPATQGLIPLVAPADRLQRANAQLRLASSICMIGGPALAGLLVAATSPAWAILVDAASFAGAVPLLLVLSLRLHDTAPDAPAVADGILGQIREGWSEFWARRWLWTVVIQSAFVNIGDYAGALLIMPVAAREFYNGPSTWGFLISATGAGYVAGGLIGLSWRPRHPLPVSVVFLLGAAAPLAALALREPLWVLLPAALASGVCLEQHGIHWDTIMQRRLPQRILSRAYAYDQLGSELFTPVGYFCGGAVLGALGLTGALWICVGLIAVPTATVLAVVMIREGTDSGSADETTARDLHPVASGD